MKSINISTFVPAKRVMSTTEFSLWGVVGTDIILIGAKFISRCTNVSEGYMCFSNSKSKSYSNENANLCAVCNGVMTQ
jgi:hypothetical protein